MRIHKSGHTIANLADWEKLAGPKIASQWVEGRSAYEVANAWCGPQGPAVPVDFRRMLDLRKETAGLVIDEVLPEHRIRFDNNAGEPRNADLAIIGRVGRSKVAITVEAKADEPFAATVASTFSTAVERRTRIPPQSRCSENRASRTSAILTTTEGPAECRQSAVPAVNCRGGHSGVCARAACGYCGTRGARVRDR